MVEIVDAPIIEMPVAKFSKVNRAGASNAGAAGNGNREDGSVWEATSDSQNDIESDKIGWTQTNGPYGGAIMALHATPEGILFAGAVEGGIFRSTDGGETWVHANNGLRVYENNMLPTVFALAQKGNTLYAGTGGDLFYSTNGGDSWQQLTWIRKDRGIDAVAFIGDTLYIGRPEKGVFRSDDDGESWTPINDGLIYRDIRRLMVSGRTLFAKTPHSMFRLKAGENSWTKLTAVSKKIVSFAISENSLYAATADGGLFRSTDIGNFWRSIKSELMQHFSGELAAVGNTVFYIGSGSPDGRVFRSTDAGNSWTMFNTGLTNQTPLSIATLSEKTLYVATDDGVFRSMDGGESWTKINTGIINTWIDSLVFFRNALYTITGDGIVKSADGGNSWVAVNDGLVASNGATLTVSGGKLYAGTNETNYRWNPSTSGIYCLADDGNSWMPIQTKMQSAKNRMYTVDQLVDAGETFYVIAQMGQGQWLYRWKVGEDLWTDLGLKDLQWGTLAVSGKTVYVSANNGKLFRSFDEGDSWTDVRKNMRNWEQQTGTHDLAFVGRTIYVAGPRDGVFRSTDGGETWTSIVAGLSDGDIEMQLVDGTTLYGTSSRGIFRLAQESDSWERVAPMQRIVRLLALDGTTLYIGTAAEGVFRLSLDK